MDPTQQNSDLSSRCKQVRHSTAGNVLENLATHAGPCCTQLRANRQALTGQLIVSNEHRRSAKTRVCPALPIQKRWQTGDQCDQGTEKEYGNVIMIASCKLKRAAITMI